MQKISVPPTLFPVSSVKNTSETMLSRVILFSIIASSLALAVASSYILVNVSPIIAIASIVAIPAILLFFFKPEIGLMFVILVMPLEELNIDGGFSAIKLISVIVFGCAILNYVIYRPNDRLVRSPQNLIILVFLLVSLISVLVAIDPVRVLDRMSKLLRVVALYFFTINLLRSEKHLRWALWLFVIGGLLCTLYGFFDPAQVGQRFQGALGQPNGYALTMTPRIPIALALLKIEKEFWKKLLLLIMGAVITYGIILSGSRGGLLSVSLALILFVLFQPNKIFWLTVISVIFIVSIYVMPEEVKVRIGLTDTQASSDLGNSTERRLTYQLYGLELFQKHPILGIGLDGFAEAYAESEYRFLIRTRNLRVAHNTYLEIATGTGVIGLLPFVGILASALYTAFKNSKQKYMRTNPDLAILATGLVAALGGYFLGMLFGSRQYEKTLWFLLALPVILQFIMTKGKQYLMPDTVPEVPPTFVIATNE